MPAHRCSDCDANWPVDDRTKACPSCGKNTYRINPDAPDRSVAQVEQALAKAAGGFRDDPRAWRIERYLELEFDTVQAEMLADARDTAVISDRKGVPRKWAFPLHWGRAAKMLEAGASRAQIVAILT